MFYSKALLSKKGALGKVWVAGVCGVAALTKDQVVRTDVDASVDKILPDVETAYRILGLLLLGVVRIYCKKVEYLCHECDQLLESFETAHCIKPSKPTGRAMNRDLKHVKRGACARRSVVDQKDITKVKKPGRSVRTSRAEKGASSQTLVEIREAHAPADLPPIFTIPKRFELDSFDFQIAENREDDDDDHHQLPCQDTLLEKDEQHRTSYLYESYQRMTCSYADLDSACFMPAHIVIDEVSNLLYSSSRGDALERDNQNADSVCFTPVKDVLPPEMMNMMAEVNDPSEKSKRVKKPRREVNRDENEDFACPRKEVNRDENEDFACPIPLLERQEMQRSVNVVDNVACPDLDANCPITEESENGLLLGKLNTAPSVEIPYHDIEERESLESPTLRCKTRSINELSPSTPEPLPEGVTGLLEKFMVTTPAKNEKRRVTRKRRGLYNKDCISLPKDRKDKPSVKRRGTRVLCDEDIVLPNDMMRQAIVDAKDLVCKRRKAPHTYLDAWKVARIRSLPDTFMDLLFPYSTSMHLSYSTTADASESSCGESVKAKEPLSYELAESNNSCKDAQNAEREGFPDETRKRKLDELTDSMQTPINCYTQSEQFQEDVCVCNDDTGKENNTQVKGDGSSSTGLPEKRLYESENHSPLCNDALAADIDNIDADIPMDEDHTRDEGSLLSARTRTVARYLHQLFVDQKCQPGNNYVTLGQALEGRKRKTTVRFFYETLILKSRGLIEVNQQNPYENIEISATPQLEAVLQNPE